MPCHGPDAVHHPAGEQYYPAKESGAHTPGQPHARGLGERPGREQRHAAGQREHEQRDASFQEMLGSWKLTRGIGFFLWPVPPPARGYGTP